MLNSESLWPSIGDQVYVEGGEDDTNAYITHWTDWIVLAEGYATMADLAVANCTRIDRDMIAFPILFCYRHAIELYLKYTLYIARMLFNIRNSGDKLDHKLLKLWTELRPLIKQRWPNGSEADVDATEAMIKEIDALPREAHMYPVSKDKTKYITTDHSVDLVNFCQSGRKIINFLSGCADGMDDAMQAAQ